MNETGARPRQSTRDDRLGLMPDHAAGEPFLEPRRSIPRLVTVVWALLIVDTLGTQPVQTIVAIPRPLMQLITIGTVGVAFLLAMVVNRRLQIRPSAYLLLLTLLLVASLPGSATLESGLGSIVRCLRFALFISTLWLLTPWWNNALSLVRTHIRLVGAVLATVVLGLVIAPGLAMPAIDSGRLVGVIWPLTAPQVGQYSATIAGLTFLLWLARMVNRRSAVVFALVPFGLLLLSHTRTAIIGLVAGLAVAVLSMSFTNARARRAVGAAILGGGVLAVVLGPAIQVWMLRGQDQQNLSTFTGRAKVWDSLLAAPRTWLEQVFGSGLSNKSFNGLPIDNSWFAAYQEQGLVGVTLVALFLAVLLGVAVARPPSPARACALFLVVYAIAASYTEASLADASPMLLNLTLAAALLSAANRVADGAVNHPQRTTK
ncbi:MAG TPA: O-antigen ligase domain-containing protein [Actinophytocola sp.]|jgi:O-antigen ligase|uniref:O-antigen ligase domain-containing protein n=1 Tax=Actinophytocola sp. TaxID=1872138 RepID=UPI002F9276BB